MELFFDTETSGLPNSKLALDDPAQPYIVQLGLILSDKDQIHHKMSLIAKAHDREMNPYAQKVHGITVERCDTVGFNLEEILYILRGFLGKADEVISHNYEFDAKIIRIVCASVGDTLTHELFNNTPYFCTMKGSTELCKLPKKRGSGYKYPKLEELHEILLNCSFEGAHDALCDAAAMRNCYYALKERLAEEA